ncbi:hypothetical protein PHISP_01401 [Aspergillus sp. HF37]|nr:hypothetical protein PHISP_01401 [Aspergillus sp. HF37]
MPLSISPLLNRDHITPGPAQKRSLIGSGQDHLADQLESLYWEGIQRKLENVTSTLRRWQEPDLADIALEEEADEHIHGFDTFLDQVSYDSRAFAAQYPHVSPSLDGLKGIERHRASKIGANEVVDRIADLKVERSSAELRTAVRQAISAPRFKPSNVDKHRKVSVNFAANSG